MDGCKFIYIIGSCVTEIRCFFADFGKSSKFARLEIVNADVRAHSTYKIRCGADGNIDRYRFAHRFPLPDS